MTVTKECPMPLLFRQCALILEETQRPWHYKALTRMALEALGRFESGRSFEKNAENVREKMLQKGQYGTFYTGRPLCMGGLLHWFQTEQFSIATDLLAVPLKPALCLDAGIEAVLRPMIQKNPYASREKIATVRVRGLALEWHWTAWFQANWPEFFAQPDNFKKYYEPCNHDFKLNIGGRTYTVDVAGPDKNGVHGMRGDKKTADIHLLCRINGEVCEWDGVVRGRYFSRELNAVHIVSPATLLVWLNCYRHGLDYQKIKDHISPERIAA
jgi:hypothetical protein